jgi:hypothetical protein
MRWIWSGYEGFGAAWWLWSGHDGVGADMMVLEQSSMVPEWSLMDSEPNSTVSERNSMDVERT